MARPLEGIRVLEIGHQLAGPFCGILADRFDRRKTLAVTQLVWAISSLAIMTLFFLSQLQVWHLLIYVLISGLGHAVNFSTQFALAATRYFKQYGLTPEEGKRTLAKISVKSHYCGARNPKSFLQREVSLDEVANAPMIAWPLGLYDCCGVTDGASATILCRTEDVNTFAKNHKHDYITIKGVGVSVGPGWGKNKEDYDFTHWPETEHAARQAYQMAGIKNPRNELDMAEIHDCFSIAELIASESLGFCGKGQAKKELIDNGAFIAPQFRDEVMKKWGASEQEIRNRPDPEDVLPVNVSGGLKSFGHPMGASGGREVYEIYKQIQGKAEDASRQLKNVRLGLTHNQGGHPGRFDAAVLILGAP